MNKTRKKIILSAIEAFNQHGVMNVRNQDIASAAGVSLSNYNYHFKTKGDLVYAVCMYMVELLKERVYGTRMLVGSEGYGLEIMRAYFEFEQEFKFFYLDTFNILQLFPSLRPAFEERLNEAIQIIKNLNFLAIGRGAMRPEPPEKPGLYDQLAEQIWINNHFWFAQMSIRGLDDRAVLKGMEANYAIMYPYLTEKGRQNYESYLVQLRDGNLPD